MTILYISNLCSPKLLDYIFKTTEENPGFAAQKFNKLIAEGLANNNIRVQTITAIQSPKRIFPLFCKIKSEYFNKIFYNYIPFINLPFLRQVCLMIYTFFYVIKWSLKTKGDKYIISDVLCNSIGIGGLLASKICRITNCGIMTDVFGLIYGRKASRIKKIIARINSIYIKNFDKYVFLTEDMNKIVNKRNKPHIIMEGLVENGIKQNTSKLDFNKRNVLLYAGGLQERYGIKMLIDAFIALNRSDLVLEIYGHGDMVERIKRISKKHSNIKYQGIVPNNIIIDKERNALLLINPRPTHEEFTKYSFPSKNMEYMASGTPLLTTKLPGMPKEYYPYVYLFEEESTDGYEKKLKEILKHPLENLEKKGRSAQKWIRENKNNEIQTKRIIKLIKQ